MALRIGHLSTFYHTAIILMARHEPGESLLNKIEWRLFGTGPSIVEAFRKGELDIAYIGLPPAIIGISQGLRIKCVAGGHIEGTVLSGKGQYKGSPETDNLRDILTQFCGRKIGVPGKGSIHDVILTEYLDRFNLKGEIEIVNFRWADEVTEAIVKDRVAAALGTPALAVAIQRYADGKILYSPSKIWPNNPSYGILVNSDFMNREREAVKAFLRLHEDATAFIRTMPHEAARLISGFVGVVDEAFVIDTIRVSPKYCAKITDGYIQATMDFVKTLYKLGYIKREIEQDEIFDTSMIDEIHPSKDHYGDGIAGF